MSVRPVLPTKGMDVPAGVADANAAVVRSTEPLVPWTRVDFFPFSGDYSRQDLQLPETEHLHAYPVAAVAKNSDRFIQAAARLYAVEKSIVLKGPLDLREISHVDRLDCHVKVHAITGLPQWGTSNTSSIPYWDRQAYLWGLNYHFGPSARRMSAVADAETINALRGFIAIASADFARNHSFCVALQKQLDGPKVTHRDLREEHRRRLTAFDLLARDYRRVLIDKIKHLVVIADQLVDQSSRLFLLDEVCQIIEAAAIPRQQLAINLGIDGGLSPESDRPAYRIDGLMQLAHLGQVIWAVAPAECPTWQPNEWERSLARPTGSASLLREPPCFALDWKP